MDEPKTPNRKERRAMEAQGQMTDRKFMEIADRFIDVANRENQSVKATDLHMIMLYAAARYNAHVCKNVVEVDDQETFVTEMLKAYQEMLRNHLADPSVLYRIVSIAGVIFVDPEIRLAKITRIALFGLRLFKTRHNPADIGQRSHCLKQR